MCRERQRQDPATAATIVLQKVPALHVHDLKGLQDKLCRAHDKPTDCVELLQTATLNELTLKPTVRQLYPSTNHLNHLGPIRHVLKIWLDGAL